MRVPFSQTLIARVPGDVRRLIFDQTGAEWSDRLPLCSREAREWVRAQAADQVRAAALRIDVDPTTGEPTRRALCLANLRHGLVLDAVEAGGAELEALREEIARICVKGRSRKDKEHGRFLAAQAHAGFGAEVLACAAASGSRRAMALALRATSRRGLRPPWMMAVRAAANLGVFGASCCSALAAAWIADAYPSAGGAFLLSEKDYEDRHFDPERLALSARRGFRRSAWSDVFAYAAATLLLRGQGAELLRAIAAAEGSISDASAFLEREKAAGKLVAMRQEAWRTAFADAILRPMVLVVATSGDADLIGALLPGGASDPALLPTTPTGGAYCTARAVLGQVFRLGTMSGLALSRVLHPASRPRLLGLYPLMADLHPLLPAAEALLDPSETNSSVSGSLSIDCGTWEGGWCSALVRALLPLLRATSAEEAISRTRELLDGLDRKGKKDCVKQHAFRVLREADACARARGDVQRQMFICEILPRVCRSPDVAEWNLQVAAMRAVPLSTNVALMQQLSEARRTGDWTASLSAALTEASLLGPGICDMRRVTARLLLLCVYAWRSGTSNPMAAFGAIPDGAAEKRLSGAIARLGMGQYAADFGAMMAAARAPPPREEEEEEKKEEPERKRRRLCKELLSDLAERPPSSQAERALKRLLDAMEAHDK